MMRRIRTRLMIAILVAALLPAAPMSLVVGNLLERSLNPALHAELTAGLEAGMAVSRENLVRKKGAFMVAAERASRRAAPPVTGGETPWIILDERGNPNSVADWNPDPATRLTETPRLVDGHLAVKLDGPAGQPVIIAQRVPETMIAQADDIAEAVSLLAAFQLEREPILRSYIMPFLLVYAFLVAAALAVAALLSNKLARPLEDMARAAAAVAEGNLNTRVETSSGGEVGALVNAFNEMVARLDQQRSDLARLEKLSAWRGMARVLAHEIKNPLTPILLAVQQAKTSYQGEDEAHAEVLSECEAIVSEEVDGLRELVRSFSDFARTPQPEFKAENLSDLLQGLDRLYGDRLELAPGSETDEWVIDGGQIKRVLINLIDNGLTACERAQVEPRVSINLVEFHDQLQINVQDQGGGISPSDLQRIFEPDFTTSSQGMGLGLPIAEGIVLAHGGKIKIVTRGADMGTRFTIALPRNPSEERL